MIITFPISTILIIGLILYTIITHLFNWLIRSAWELDESLVMVPLLINVGIITIIWTLLLEIK